MTAGPSWCVQVDILVIIGRNSDHFRSSINGGIRSALSANSLIRVHRLGRKSGTSQIFVSARACFVYTGIELL